MTQSRDPYPHRDITEGIIGAAMEVHDVLGPGLLESAYQRCLAREMELRGISFEKELFFPVRYKDLQLEAGYRIDFVVEDAVVVETKAIKKLEEVHRSQVLTYLQQSGKKVGLLINFHVSRLKHGIMRVVR